MTVCVKPVRNTRSSYVIFSSFRAKEVWESSKVALPFEIRPSWDFIDVVWHPRIVGTYNSHLLRGLEK